MPPSPPPPPEAPSPLPPPLPPDLPPLGSCVAQGPERLRYAVHRASTTGLVASSEASEAQHATDAWPEAAAELSASLSLAAAALVAAAAFLIAQRGARACGAVAPTGHGRLALVPLGGCRPRTQTSDVAAQPTAAATSAASRAEVFPGLNGARLLASVHIVLGHLYQLNALPGGAYFLAWGYTWARPHVH